MLNIVLFGPPGAGKGTQSEKLINKYELVHLSTGDIFRANIKGQTELGNLAKSYMDQGQLVPDNVTIRMLEAEVLKNRDAKGFIFDGFPRTQAQAIALDALLAGIGTSITLMVALEVEENELKKRLLLRGQNSGRPDDQNPDIIQNRIDVYNRETAPVKEYYTAQGKYEGVYGIGEIERIFGDLSAVINKYTSNVTVGNFNIHPVSKPVVKLQSNDVAKSISKKAAAPAKTVKKKATVKKAVKKAAVKKTATKKKAAPKKKVAKKLVKKSPKKNLAVKKKTAKKAVKKSPVKKVQKPVVKKVVKKAAKKSAVKKVAKKVTVKKSLKKAVKNLPKKATAKKVAPKKKVQKSTVKKAVKKLAKRTVKKAISKKAAVKKKVTPKKAAKKITKPTRKVVKKTSKRRK